MTKRPQALHPSSLRLFWTWHSGELFRPIPRFDDINLEQLIDVPEETKAEIDETLLFG